MAESAAAPPKGRASRPLLNASDVPEMMPGAQPRANPAQRERFEQRCKQLRQEDVEQEAAQAHARPERAVNAGAAPAAGESLEAMFPMLDPGLVRAIASDCPTQAVAIDTLLKLSAEMSEPAAPRPPSPERDLKVGDASVFPGLVDSDGWEVPAPQQLASKADDDGELGSAWRDRAKAGANAPAPKPRPRPLAPAWGARRKEGEDREAARDAQEPEVYTDYEMRHIQGQKRAQRRGFGRGAARAGTGAEDISEEEEDEEGEEMA